MLPRRGRGPRILCSIESKSTGATVMRGALRVVADLDIDDDTEVIAGPRSPGRMVIGEPGCPDVTMSMRMGMRRADEDIVEPTPASGLQDDLVHHRAGPGGCR